MNKFTGPDAERYDLHCLPPHISRDGLTLTYNAGMFEVFTFTIRDGRLPEKIADWDVPTWAKAKRTPLKGFRL